MLSALELGTLQGSTNTFHQTAVASGLGQYPLPHADLFFAQKCALTTSVSQRGMDHDVLLHLAFCLPSRRAWDAQYDSGYGVCG